MYQAIKSILILTRTSKKTPSFGGRFNRGLLICISILINSSISPSNRGHLHPKSVSFIFLTKNTTATTERNTQSPLNLLQSALSQILKVSQTWSENGDNCYYMSISILRPRTVPYLVVSGSSNHDEIAGLSKLGHQEMG